MNDKSTIEQELIDEDEQVSFIDHNYERPSCGKICVVYTIGMSSIITLGAIIGIGCSYIRI